MAKARTLHGNFEKAPSPFFKRFVKQFVFNSLLVFFSCVVALGGIEVCLRICSMFQPVEATIAQTLSAATFGVLTASPGAKAARSMFPDADVERIKNLSSAVPRPSTTSEIQIPAALIERSEIRHRYLTMPDAWNRRVVQMPGAATSYYWQGALHTVDAVGFRRTAPLPDKKPDVYRVIVVGDSLTFGYGIDEKDTFVALLNDWLGKDYRVELLNLGVSGYQSEDVLNEIKKYVPSLKPNLVIYAICLNDFLPSGVLQYSGNSYSTPLPNRLKSFLISHTYTGAFLNKVYDGALRRLHLRADFFDDILSNFAHDNDRFRKDVAAMDTFVRAEGLPPVVAMVVDHLPHYGGRGYRIAMMAEDAVRAAGAELIPTTDYYIRYNGKNMYVSRWEGHPDEVANYIWASMFANELRQRQDLQAFKR